MTLKAFQMLVAVVSGLARSRGKTELSEQLDLVNDLTSHGSEASAEIDALSDEIRAMVEADRDPTPEELAAVRTKRAELSARLRSGGPTLPSAPVDPAGSLETGSGAGGTDAGEGQ